MKKRNDLFRNIATVKVPKAKQFSLSFIIPSIQTALVAKAVSCPGKPNMYASGREDSINERLQYNDVIDDSLKNQPGPNFFDH